MLDLSGFNILIPTSDIQKPQETAKEEQFVTVSPCTGKPLEYIVGTPLPGLAQTISREEFDIKTRFENMNIMRASYDFLKFKLFSTVIKHHLSIEVKLVERYFMAIPTDVDENVFFRSKAVFSVLNDIGFLNDARCHSLMKHLSLTRCFVDLRDDDIIKVLNDILIEESLKENNRCKAIEALDFLKTKTSPVVTEDFCSRRDQMFREILEHENSYKAEYKNIKRDVYKELLKAKSIEGFENVEDAIMDDVLSETKFLGNGNSHRLILENAKNFGKFKYSDILFRHKCLMAQALSPDNLRRFFEANSIMQHTL